MIPGLPLFDHVPPINLQGDRDGETFNRARDRKRLDTAMDRVFSVLKDKNWHTLRELADKAGCSETCASARVRDLRKHQHGGWKVEREYVDAGLWRYRWTGEKA